MHEEESKIFTIWKSSRAALDRDGLDQTFAEDKIFAGSCWTIDEALTQEKIGKGNAQACDSWSIQSEIECGYSWYR